MIFDNLKLFLFTLRICLDKAKLSEKNKIMVILIDFKLKINNSITF